MIQNSALDFRSNFNHALNMLVIANFTPRDPATGRATAQLTKEQIEQYRARINMDEVTQGYLWTEATLLPQRQVIQWPLIDTQQVANSPVTPTMRLLTMQDSFLISTMSYFLMQYFYIDGSQDNPSFSQAQVTWTPITFVSTWNNNDTEVNLDPGCALFWIGSYISLEVNKRMLIPYWDCYRHYKAPNRQATPSFPNPSAYVPQTHMEHDGSVDGFYPVEPNVVIGGGRGNIMKLNLAANIPSDIAPFNQNAYNDTFVMKAVVCMRGILMQNSTSVK